MDPKLKFIIVTIDELILVSIAIVIVYFLAPEYTLPIAIVSIILTCVYVYGKWRVIYPTLALTGSYDLYDLIGMNGVVTATVSQDAGKVRVGQEIWTARCTEGEIQKGTTVKIKSKQSLVIHVAPIE